ncbi:unnamed protein product [Agarophyton chilense]|eukprot:gb/GEZJ01002607.1/.p1 GENE.gb/GEZJ01002607.1/~~gb/GEZJ01002607.1/.p1  ORF type:complete len:527 (+),score=46.12 gb/GEZJ01002607.1/:385-1965(+)
MNTAKSSSTKVKRPRGQGRGGAVARKREHSPNGGRPDPCRRHNLEHAHDLFFPGFYLLKTIGVNATFPTIRIEDIVLPGADLALICNYKFDVPWFWHRAPAIQTCRKVLLVHGERVDEEEVWKKFLEGEGAVDRVRFVRPETPLYGTVHSKVFALFYSNGCRICIHTANMVQQDWDYKTQGAYVRDFPKIERQASQRVGNQDFKNQLLRYFAASLKGTERHEVLEAIEKYDYSSADVALISSIPGVHEAEQNGWYGHQRLRSVLRDVVEEPDDDSVAVCQFSSLGSIQEKWLREEFGETLFASKRSFKPKRPKHSNEIQLVYPTLNQVQESNEGIVAGSSLPVSGRNMHREHILSKLHKWDASISNRERAMPHIKTFLRYPRTQAQSPLWVLLGSFNLSVAAWGRSLKPARKKTADRSKILSYELGVLFAPQLSCPAVFHLEHGTIFKTFSSQEHHSWLGARSKCSVSLRLCGSHWRSRDEYNEEGGITIGPSALNVVHLPIPYRLPAEQYQTKDTPWTVDLCSVT